MKRIVVGLLATCLCVIANAQIQTKFWGLELSEHYTSLTSAKNIISDRCAYASVEDDSIYALVGKFGGHTWNLVTFGFYQGVYSKALCSVSFIKECDDKDSAITMYTSLMRSLNDKYKDCSKVIGDDMQAIWSDSVDKYRCSLTLDGKTNGVWFVTLIYCDRGLLELALEQEESEL